MRPDEIDYYPFEKTLSSGGSRVTVLKKNKSRNNKEGINTNASASNYNAYPTGTPYHHNHHPHNYQIYHSNQLKKSSNSNIYKYWAKLLDVSMSSGAIMNRLIPPPGGIVLRPSSSSGKRPQPNSNNSTLTKSYHNMR